ncbi:benzoate/H(+) symporter BenE family transporter [uncultured Lentibacter sp.]|uniref:benzoate/H(+) symporter BenE family transporter n=1 Tax=uncultured Lentibacter sp. TaxID=1659309 RepID=UPI00261BFF42|nr:benzoate/H(+) symporter BenE family transporter [uncultured Lentibacter sp.]
MTLPPLQTVSTGLVVAVVGFFSSFPIVLQGLAAMGASPAQASSGLMAAALSMGLTAIVISLVSRQPASVAWSTPGAAFLAVSVAPAGGFAEAVGAFLLAGALTVLAGLYRPLRQLAANVPLPLAHALLAGVLVHICAQPFLALATAPATAVPILLTWFLAGQLSRLFAVPAAVLMALALTLWPAGVPLREALLAAPVLTTPAFSLTSAFSLALPLFIITMATQNSPGMAVLRGEGYPPRPRGFLSAVGLASLASAPFGAPQTCLAAITSSLCAGPDSHPDPQKRYLSAVMAGLFYCAFGLFAALIIAVAAAAPPQTLEVLAGLALLGVFANSANLALTEPKAREAAAITFLTTASGVTLLGLSGAVWGLALGSIAYFVAHKR